MRAISAESARALARGVGADRIVILAADASGVFAVTLWGATAAAEADLAGWLADGCDAGLSMELGAKPGPRAGAILAGPALPEPPR